MRSHTVGSRAWVLGSGVEDVWSVHLDSSYLYFSIFFRPEKVGSGVFTQLDVDEYMGYAKTFVPAQ